MEVKNEKVYFDVANWSRITFAIVPARISRSKSMSAIVSKKRCDVVSIGRNLTRLYDVA